MQDKRSPMTQSCCSAFHALILVTTVVVMLVDCHLVIHVDCSYVKWRNISLETLLCLQQEASCYNYTAVATAHYDMSC